MESGGWEIWRGFAHEAYFCQGFEAAIFCLPVPVFFSETLARTLGDTVCASPWNPMKCPTEAKTYTPCG
jgi:hypothetical protein